MRCLRACVGKMLDNHSIVFNKMMSRLELSADDEAADVELGFNAMAEELFARNEVSWGKIVALFAFGARLAQHYCSPSQGPPARSDMIFGIAGEKYYHGKLLQRFSFCQIEELHLEVLADVTRKLKLLQAFFVRLEQNLVRKKLKYYPILSSNFLQNSDFRKSTICKMSFLLHIKTSHYKKLSSRAETQLKCCKTQIFFGQNSVFRKSYACYCFKKVDKRKA